MRRFAWVVAGPVAALGLLAVLPAAAVAAVDKAAVATTYGDIAQAMYEDALARAKTLDAAVGALVAGPSAATLDAAKAAWLAARKPYQQTEAYRFGNAIVDDWEGKVNAWPLDEGLIDYVDAAYGNDSEENPLYTANVIATAPSSTAPTPSISARSPRRCSPTRCRRSAGSRPMSPPAITPSSSCCGART